MVGERSRFHSPWERPITSVTGHVLGSELYFEHDQVGKASPSGLLVYAAVLFGLR